MISFGATARGAVTALTALGISDVTVLTHRNVPAVASPIPSVRMVHFEAVTEDPARILVLTPGGPAPIAEFLARHDIVVDCVLQDTDAPLMFVTRDELRLFAPGSLFVDVSCDEGMGFEWARPTSSRSQCSPWARPCTITESTTARPTVELRHLGDQRGADSAPGYRDGRPGGWDRDDTIRRAIEIRDGVIRNPKILSFQRRSAEFPHIRM